MRFGTNTWQFKSEKCTFSEMKYLQFHLDASVANYFAQGVYSSWKLLEFDIPPGNTGNVLKCNWSSWKIVKC